MISQRAVDAIISFEVSSRAYYEKHYQHPEWPGGQSGVTIGIGYDMGYSSLAKLSEDWNGRVSQPMLNTMQRCLGVKGEAAHSLLPAVKDSITIPWDSAMGVFLERDIPEWTNTVCKSIPKANKLSPDCLGALVSLAYNRGASFDAQGDRYQEMRAIKAHIGQGNLPAVANDIRAMKRLWPDVPGLQGRRESEAKLWELGLDPKTAQAGIPDRPHAPTAKPKPAIPPKPGHAQGGAVAAGGIMAAFAAIKAFGLEHPLALVIVLAIGAAIGIVGWMVVKDKLASPILAREKDIAAETSNIVAGAKSEAEKVL